MERAAAAVKLARAGAPNDPGYPQQWALPKIGWDQAYGVVPVGGSAKIAVLDTGVDAIHPDLAGRMAAGQSFVGSNPDSDPNGHGTALAGIAAAVVNNATGVAAMAYASGVSISSVQVLGADGTGWDADVVAGVLWAADNGASVILMGFSSSTYSAAQADALAYAWSKGAVLIAATGNDGSTAATYPAGIPNVIGVTATDQNDAVTSGSNTGSAAVGAPGPSIYTTQAGGGYGTVGGTSAAAAHVAGLAALLRASGKNNADAANQIRGTVDPISGKPFGRINVARALGAPVAPLPTATPVAATPTPAATPTYSIAATVDTVSIDIRALNCSTPQTIFVSGSTVCAHAEVTITGGGTADYRLQWYAPGNPNPVRDVLFDNMIAGTYSHNNTYQVATVGTWTVLVCKTKNAGNCSSGNRLGAVTFTVNANAQPVAAFQSVITAEDTAKSITLSRSDADGNNLSFSIATGPSHGTLSSIGTITCTPNTPSSGTTTCTTTITYTPNANYNGTDSFTFKVNDGTGASNAESTPATVSITITPVNDPPTVTVNTATVTVNEGQQANNSGSYGDVDGDEVTLTASIGTVTKNNIGTWSWSFTTTDGPAQNQTVTITANDGNGGTASATFTLTVQNVPLTATLSNTGPVDEGSPVTVSFSNQSDPSSGDTTAGFRYAFSCTNGDLSGATDATSSASGSTSCTFADNGTYTVKGHIVDKDGGFTEYTTQVTVNNVPPTITSLSVAVVSRTTTSPLNGPVPAGTTIQVTVSFTDPGSVDTHTGTIYWDWTTYADSSTSTGGVSTVCSSTSTSTSCSLASSADGSTKSFIASYKYMSASVYTIRVTVQDKDGGMDDEKYEYVVVYDPSAGFVTGGGWIDSPLRACKLSEACQGATGSANFGFVSKYQKGAKVPTGETEFQFKAGNLNFHSTAY